MSASVVIDAGLFFLILSSRYFLLIEKYQCWNMLRLMGALHHLLNGKVEFYGMLLNFTACLSTYPRKPSPFEFENF